MISHEVAVLWMSFVIVIQKVVETLATETCFIQQSTVVVRWARHIEHIRERINSDILGKNILREHLLDPNIDGR
jgi:hypothetical protein